MTDDKDMLYEWTMHPVTVEYFAAIRQRISDVKDELVAYAASGEPRELSHKAGYIQALQDMLEAHV